MSITSIPKALRDHVRRRAFGCCEFCGIHEDDVWEPHEPDHLIAEQHGGVTTFDNLAFTCAKCNRRKGTNLSSIDPATGKIIRLFNPRRDQWYKHFQLQGAQIEPLTAIGRATVTLLRLNAPNRLRIREGLISIGRYPTRQHKR